MAMHQLEACPGVADFLIHTSSLPPSRQSSRTWVKTQSLGTTGVGPSGRSFARPGRIHAHAPSRSVTPQDPHRVGGRSFLPVRDWIWVVVTGWLQVGNTGFQQSVADVLHFRLLGIVQGVDK